MKKIIFSGAMVVAIAAIVVTATTAYFSDTETSTGNTFTAGEINLKVDSECSYNGNTENCEGNWGQEEEEGGIDIKDEKFFNFTDVKPGDVGENTISLHVVDNDAWVCATVSGLTSTENGCNEPELGAEPNCLTNGDGELQNAMEWTIWRDDGDNIKEDGEAVLASGKPVNGTLALYDSTTGAPLTGNTTAYLGVSWTLPAVVGNEVQSDSMTGDISFNVVQSRNNPNFRCVPPETIEVTSALMQFGPTGWAGWSCPTTHPNIISGTTNCAQPLTNSLAWQTGATVGTYSYPLTPFGYSYGAGEEGWIVQNGGTGQNCNIILTCQAN